MDDEFEDDFAIEVHAELSMSKSCYNCNWFDHGSAQTRMHPGDPPECNHPVSNCCTTLPNFPFLNGCKHFESK